MLTDEVLVALRRIIRAVDLQSRTLKRRCGLTGPQALVLRALCGHDGISVSDLARRARLSQATVTDILGRLEREGLVARRRSAQDRRRLMIFITALGRKRLDDAMPLLQEAFVQRFEQLESWEQTQLTASLQRVAEMMDAEALEPVPMLAAEQLDEAGAGDARTPLTQAGKREA